MDRGHSELSCVGKVDANPLELTEKLQLSFRHKETPSLALAIGGEVHFPNFNFSWDWEVELFWNG